MSLDLPPDWENIKLKNASRKIHYGYTASSQAENVGPKLLRITDIQNKRVNWDIVPYCKISKDEIAKYRLEEKDIVFARTGATVGKSFLIKGKIPEAVFASYLIRLQLSDKTLPEYVYLFFQSNNYWTQIKSSSAGIGQPNVNASKLADISFPLPPLPEQKKIVAKIEELFSGLDSGIAELKKVKQQIKVYRQAVLAAAFSGKLVKKDDIFSKDVIFSRKVAEPEPVYGGGNGNLPEGWKIVRISDIGEVVSGGTPSTKIPEYFDGNIAWITPADLTGYKEKYISRGRRNISELGLKNSSARLVRKGSILFSSRAPIGYVVISKNEVATNQGFKNLMINKNINKEYVYYYLKSAKQLAERYASGTTFKEISAKSFANLPFPLVSISQQTQIVGEIEKRFSVADNLEKAVDEGLAKAESLRQSILKQAFEGRLINDSN